MGLKIKRKIAKCLAFIKRGFRFFEIRRKLKNKKYTHLFIGTPKYGNLGDHQIRKSTIEYFKKKKIKFIEISLFEYRPDDMNLSNIKVICLQGGGNFGDVYLQEEFLRGDIIRRFKDKKIVLLPQTIYYETDEPGSEMDLTKRIYNTHPNLILTAREKVSFEQMKKDFPNNKVILSPDIVLNSDYTKRSYKRKNYCLFLTRRDLEKKVSNEFLQQLKDKLDKMGYNILQEDTLIDYFPFTIFDKYELNKLFKKIKKAKFVITDRLHGMVFCAITNTPCIVFSNYNHKVKGTYDWLKHLSFIKFIEDSSSLKLEESVNEILSSSTSWHPLDKEFKELDKQLAVANE